MYLLHEQLARDRMADRRRRADADRLAQTAAGGAARPRRSTARRAALRVRLALAVGR
jgi:hypothetical protein